MENETSLLWRSFYGTIREQTISRNRMSLLPQKRSVTTCGDGLKEESPDSDPISDPDPFPLVCKKTQCIFCVGNEVLPLKDRTKSFCRPAIMMDQVEDVHLRRIPAGQTAVCRHPKCTPKCSHHPECTSKCKSNGLVFNNMMHFKNHVQTVHGISLRA